MFGPAVGSVQPGAQPKSRRAHVESAGSKAPDLVTAAVFTGMSCPGLGAVVLRMRLPWGQAGGVCWWELFQNSHRTLAGRGSGRWDLGLLIRGCGDAPLSPTGHVPPPARPGALGSGLPGQQHYWGGDLCSVHTGPEGHIGRLELAGDGGTQDGRAQLCSQESMKTQK